MVKQIVLLHFLLSSYSVLYTMDDRTLVNLDPKENAAQIIQIIGMQKFEDAERAIRKQFQKTITRINNSAHWQLFYQAAPEQGNATYEDAVLLVCQLPSDLQKHIIFSFIFDDISGEVQRKLFCMPICKAFERYAEFEHESSTGIKHFFSSDARLALSPEQTILIRRMIFNEDNGNGEQHYITFDNPYKATHCTFLSPHDKNLLKTLPQEFIDADNQKHVLEKLMVCEHPSILSKVWKTPLKAFWEAERAKKQQRSTWCSLL